MTASSLPKNPLARCTIPTNCYRKSRAFDRSPDKLFADALACVRELSGLTIGHAVEIEREQQQLRLHASFRVFVFTDDLDLTVAPFDGGAVLHVRSASRVGAGDLGINRRRVLALLDAIAA